MSRTTSPPRLSADLAGERASVSGTSQISLEEENVSLRKQVRQLETDAKMNKALMEQKIELLETQITEFQEREINLKKMNETIMFALNDISKDQNPLVNKTAKELELATERHNKEMQEYRARTSELIKNLEGENKKLKEGTTEHELRIKELTLHFEKAQMGHYQTLNALEQEKAELENKIKRVEEEKLLIRESSDNEVIQKINELKNINERLKEEHKKELQRSKEGYEKSVQDMKASHENEKRNMETRMGKLQELLLQEGGRREASTAEIHNKYQKEIQSLKDTINEIKTDHMIELNEINRAKLEANEKCEKLDTQVKKLKTMVKTAQESQEQNTKLLKDKLDKAKSVMEHGENILEENKKYKQKIVELKSHVKKMEVSEQKLKDIIHEKELQISDDRFEFRKMLNFDQSVMSQSVQEPRLSQSMNQGKLMHQTSATKSTDEPQSYTNRRSINSSLFPPTSGVHQGDYPQYSPLREKSLNVDSRPVSSHRYNRTVSSPVSITPPKHMKSNENDPDNERPISTTHRKTEVTERKTHQNNSLMTTPVDDVKAHHEAYDSQPPNQASSTVQRKAPLETSFADHGFAIENEMEPARVETSVMDKRRDSKDKRSGKPVDIDSIPINYNEFIKRTQRSSEHTIDPEKLLHNETEMKTENTTESGPPIFFTTSQDDNPPLFGTSHFVFEGMHDLQDVQEEEDVDKIVPVMSKSSDKRKNLEQEREREREREKEREREREREWEREREKAQEREREREREREKRLQYERELARKLEDFDRKTSTLEDDDFDIVEISDTNEPIDDEGLSVSLHRRRSSAKSYVREDMDTRPSMMNPMNTVYESDGFNEPPTSMGYLSGHPRSVMDRDREREREREKIFSTRCSVSNSIYKPDTGVPGVKSNNESRHKIEGRLKDLEWKLKDMELKNKGLKVEKDKVQFEFEKLLQELKDKKAESESIKSMTSVGSKDEKREDREGALKNEIKFLINKLLKVKNKLEKQSEELNVTRSINTLGQSQINNSISGYYLPGKKDYSKDYGTLVGGYQNVSQERENWNPRHMQSNSMSVLNPQNLSRNDYSDILNVTSSQLNTSVSRLDKYKVPEKRASVKGSLEVPSENFATNRSKSNARYDYGRDSNNASVQNSGVKNRDNAPISTNRTHRSRMPNLPRPDEVTASLGNLLGKDVLRSNINTHNYESYNLNNVSSGGYDTVSKFIYQRKSTR